MLTLHSTALRRLDDDEKKSLRLAQGNRGNPNVTFITESGLYALILRSDKPEAKRFRNKQGSHPPRPTRMVPD